MVILIDCCYGGLGHRHVSQLKTGVSGSIPSAGSIGAQHIAIFVDISISRCWASPILISSCIPWHFT